MGRGGGVDRERPCIEVCKKDGGASFAHPGPKRREREEQKKYGGALSNRGGTVEPTDVRRDGVSWQKMEEKKAELVTTTSCTPQGVSPDDRKGRNEKVGRVGDVDGGRPCIGVGKKDGGPSFAHPGPKQREREEQKKYGGALSNRGGTVEPTDVRRDGVSWRKMEEKKVELVTTTSCTPKGVSPDDGNGRNEPVERGAGVDGGRTCSGNVWKKDGGRSFAHPEPKGREHEEERLESGDKIISRDCPRDVNDTLWHGHDVYRAEPGKTRPTSSPRYDVPRHENDPVMQGDDNGQGYNAYGGVAELGIPHRGGGYPRGTGRLNDSQTFAGHRARGEEWVERRFCERRGEGRYYGGGDTYHARRSVENH